MDLSYGNSTYKRSFRFNLFFGCEVSCLQAFNSFPNFIKNLFFIKGCDHSIINNDFTLDDDCFNTIA